MKVNKKSIGDMVNHPDHYKGTINFECIDVMETVFSKDDCRSYYLMSAWKYIWRMGLKDPNKKLEDCRKAKWYLDRFVKYFGGSEYDKYYQIYLLLKEKTSEVLADSDSENN